MDIGNILNFLKSGGTNFNLLQDQANPNDPAQQAQWGIGSGVDTARQASQVNLFDPETLRQLQEMFAPLFQQQQANFTGQFGQARQQQLGEAGRSAGAMAAARGYNPSSFVRGAQGRVNENLNPQFFSGIGGLQQNQLQNLLSGTQASNQFRREGLGGLSNAQFQGANFWENRNMFNQQQNNQPTFLENLFSGLIGGGSNLLSGMATGGTGLFGK